MENSSFLLDRYKRCFQSLNVNTNKGRIAPHKPVLLLSIIELVEEQKIEDERVFLNDELIDKFHKLWNRWAGSGTFYKPDISKPFFHLQHEPFWRLVSREELMKMEDMACEPEVKDMEPKKNPKYNITSLRRDFAYGLIDIELYELMNDKDARVELSKILISYFGDRKIKHGTGSVIAMSSLIALLIA